MDVTSQIVILMCTISLARHSIGRLRSKFKRASFLSRLSAKRKSREITPGVVQTGTYIFANGDKYEGEYILTEQGTNERSGSGSHVTTDGTKYNGEWQGDKMNGTGRIEFPSGSSYEGVFVNNKFEGKGTYTWPNGSHYDGLFSESRLEGDGEFTDTDGQIWHGMFHHHAAPGLRFKLCL